MTFHEAIPGHIWQGEYTHEGDRCTFEVLLDRFGLEDPALRAITTHHYSAAHDSPENRKFVEAFGEAYPEIAGLVPASRS